MRSVVIRNGLRLLMLGAIILVIGLGVATAVIMSGPAEIGVLRGRIAETIKQGLGGGYEVEVARTSIGVDPVLGLVVLADDIRISDESGEVVAAIPSTRLAVEPFSLLTLRAVIRSVELTDAHLSFVRTEEGAVRLAVTDTTERPAVSAPRPADTAAEGAAPPPAEVHGEGDIRGFPDLVAALQILDQGVEPPINAAVRAGFERFSIVGGRIDIWDEGGQQQRSFQHTDMSIEVDPDNREARIALGAAGYSGRWTLTAERLIDRESMARTFSIVFSQITLADVFPRLGLKQNPIRSDIPLYGRANVTFAADGSIQDATARLDMGAGMMAFGVTQQETMLLDEATLKLRWDQVRKSLIIDQASFFFGQTRGTLVGAITPVGPPAERRFTFSLESPAWVLAPRDSPARPVIARPVLIAGEIDLRNQLLTFDNAAVVTPDGSISLAGSLGFDGPTPSLALAASISPMSADTLKQMWPVFLSPGTRRWVLNHVDAGRITSGRIEAAIPSGVLWSAQPQRLPEDALRIDLRIEEAEFSTIGGIPKIVDASAHAVLAGSTFGVDIEKGAIVVPSGERVNLTSAVFAVPNTAERPAVAHLEAELAGSAAALGQIGDAEPYRSLNKQNIDPLTFAGKGVATLSAIWPLEREVPESEINWRIAVKLQDFGSSEALVGRKVSRGAVTIGISPTDLSISGKAQIDGVAADLDMVLPLSGESGDTGHQQVRLVLDDKARKNLGIGLDDIIAGTVTARFSDLPGEGDGRHYELDLTRARVVIAALGWSKGIGVAGTAAFDLTPIEGGHRLDNLLVEGPGFRLTGKGRLDEKYGLVSVDIDRFSLRRGDALSFRLTREGGGYAITANGSSFDLRGVIAKVREASRASGSAPDITVRAEIERLVGFNRETINNASLRLNARDGTIRSMVLTGVLGGQPVELNYEDNRQNASLRLVAEDAGSLLRFVDLYTKVGSGRLVVTGQRTGANAPLVGMFDMAGFTIDNEPMMVRLTRSSGDGSPNSGVNPASVPFDRMRLNYTMRNSVMVIDEALLRGATLGSIFSGSVDLRQGLISLYGTYLPNYAVNNFFGRIPIVGLVVGAGPREGLLGVTFKVEGAVSQPQVTINPISAIAPGIFRKIFEFR